MDSYTEINKVCYPSPALMLLFVHTLHTSNGMSSSDVKHVVLALLPAMAMLRKCEFISVVILS